MLQDMGKIIRFVGCKRSFVSVAQVTKEHESVDFANGFLFALYTPFFNFRVSIVFEYLHLSPCTSTVPYKYSPTHTICTLVYLFFRSPAPQPRPAAPQRRMPDPSQYVAHRRRPCARCQTCPLVRLPPAPYKHSPLLDLLEFHFPKQD